MLRPGDSINRIGDEPVCGVVLRVAVDMGDGPGTILAVKVGEATRLVNAEACGREEIVLHRLPPGMPDSAFCVPVEKIEHDGATMPCADGEERLEAFSN